MQSGKAAVAVMLSHFPSADISLYDFTVRKIDAGKQSLIEKHYLALFQKRAYHFAYRSVGHNQFVLYTCLFSSAGDTSGR